MRDDESFLSRERIGVICAVLNVIFDVLGSFLTRSYGEKMNTFEINTVRFGSASVMLWIAYLIVVCLPLFHRMTFIVSHHLRVTK